MKQEHVEIAENSSRNGLEPISGLMVFSNRVVYAWNPLPNDVVLAPSLNSFKSRLNKFWHGHALKFTPSCYIPGETVSSAIRKYRNGPTEVVLPLNNGVEDGKKW